jgi:hypothetical protein
LFGGAKKSLPKESHVKTIWHVAILDVVTGMAPLKSSWKKKKKKAKEERELKTEPLFISGSPDTAIGKCANSS